MEKIKDFLTNIVICETMIALIMVLVEAFFGDNYSFLIKFVAYIICAVGFFTTSVITGEDED